MATWRGLFGAAVLVASALGGWAADRPGQRLLDIPWASLDSVFQQRIREVTEHAIFYRDLHGIQVRSSPMVFDYLIDHPDFAATAGRVLGIVKYRIVKEREGLFWGDDAHGATGTFELMHAEAGKRVYLATGAFVKRFLPTIRGRIVLIIAFEPTTDHAGETSVINHVRGYLRIDNRILGILARIARPIVGPIVDKKVLRTYAAASKLTAQASHDPAGLLRSLETSPEIQKEELLEFRRVLRCCTDDAGPSGSPMPVPANE
jgi:hypothetical protein